VQAPDDVAEVLSLAAAAGKHAVARGLGRSYGDAAQSASGVVLDMTGCRRILAADLDAGVVTAESGLGFESLLRWAVPRGWFVPVTPGTRQVTLGGAFAADVHGKNHHRDGSLSSWVPRITLATPTGVHGVSGGSGGSSSSATRREDAEPFLASAGGLGLTGVVVDLTLQMIPIETAFMSVDTERAVDLDDCMERMAASDAGYRYSVAWIDSIASGRRLGRSVLTRGNHATVAEVKAAARRGGAGSDRRPAGGSAARRFRGLGADDLLAFDPRPPLAVPFTPRVSLLSALAVRAFNDAWFRRAPRLRTSEIQPLARFFHPLDGVAGWNRLYGPLGFRQYQVVVPFGSEAVVRRILESLASASAPSFLSVLKRFGQANEAPLSFPVGGWTLVVDLPASIPGLGALLDRFDESVVECGGRVYLAKDSRLRPDALAAMYPRLREWQRVRDALDPAGVLGSDLGLRLGLVERERA
jgi:decaprenylphospho-beta-D-ribofuranose 2-oxidase